MKQHIAQNKHIYIYMETHIYIYIHEMKIHDVNIAHLPIGPMITLNSYLATLNYAPKVIPIYVPFCWTKIVI